MALNDLQSELRTAIETILNKKTEAYDTTGTVVRVEEGTAWVHLPGGVDETPVNLTVDAKEGDTVQIRVGGGSAWLTGNASAPPTDDTKANIANERAVRSQETAEGASLAAESAIQSAQTAAAAAIEAQTALKSVVEGAATVEKAVSVMQTAIEAVIDYDPTEDTITEYFWHDADGAHILGDISGYRNDINSTGMRIVDVTSEKRIAEFGSSGIILGKPNDAKMQLDYRSLTIEDKNQNVFFSVSDFRYENGIAYISQTHYGDGVKTYFGLEYTAISDDYITRFINAGSISVASQDLHGVTLSEALPIGGILIIEYEVEEPEYAVEFTLGKRYSSAGVMSYAFGMFAQASASYSYSMGLYTQALARHSYAMGDHTISGSEHQFVIGRYNETDYLGKYAFIVGNGTGFSGGRSNALSLDWSGNLEIKGELSGKGNIILGDSTTTGALYTRLVTSARSVELFNYETSGNVGLYDRGNSSWILYSASNQRVYIPHNFTIGSTSLNGVNMQFVSGTRNGGINLSSADNFGLFDNTNNSWIIRSSGGQASGESVGDVFIPHPLTVGGKLTAPNIVHGRVQITPTAINTPTSAAVTWPDMGGTPNIALGANTVVPGTQVKGVGFSGASATGCTIWLTRDTNLTAVWVHYIAVY